MSLGTRASALVTSPLACTRLARLCLRSLEDLPLCFDSSRLIASHSRTAVCKVFVFNSHTGDPEHVFWMAGQRSGFACAGGRPHLSRTGGCKENQGLNAVSFWWWRAQPTAGETALLTPTTLR